MNTVLNPGMTQYIYNAEGQRVAKGYAINIYINNPDGLPFCPTDMSNFAVTATYVLGPSGEQMTEFDSSGAWQHTNVFNGGQLLATYDTRGLHFPQTDPLGTVRVQVSDTGTPEKTCASLPFGDGLTCTGITDPTEHHFTGKERDTESGLDYFGARYYGSNMGRFMSPDWSPDAEAVPYAKLDDPQSLNLYAYVGNNPLIRIDADGHCWPDFLCNFFTEVKNKVLHGEFTTDTSAAKIHQLVREDAQNRARSQYMEQLKSHPPEIRYGVVFTPFTLQFIGELGRPSFIPKDWNVTDPGRGRREGLKFQDPNNPHNNVRIMKGDPNSSNPGQQKDYMVIRKNGQTLDANGNPSNDPLDFHVPVGEELPPDLFGPLP